MPKKSQPSSGMPLTYQDIKQRLLALLGTEYPAGAQLPPGVELARKLKTGQRNTQRALTELAREGYVLARPARGTIVTPALSALLQRDATTKPLTGKQVGIITAGDLRLASLFTRDTIRAALRPLRAAGAVVHVHAVKEKHPVPLAQLAAQPADGYILMNLDVRLVLPQNDPGKIVAISTASLRAELLGPQVSTVTVNDENGGFLAGQAMKALGCAHVCYLGVRDQTDIAGYDDVSTTRLHGFVQGFGTPIPRAMQLATTAYGDTSGARLFQQFLTLNPRPTGIFAASDELAYGFMLAAIGHGLLPQHDYHLIGFDGQYVDPDHGHGSMFGTVVVPRRDMGRAAARLLMRHLTSPAAPPQRLSLGCTYRAARPYLPPPPQIPFVPGLGQAPLHTPAPAGE